MSIERKCPECFTWNTDNDFCSNCGASISPRQIQQERIEKLEKEEKEKPPSKIDIFLSKMKTSKNPLIKVTYYILASIWAVYMVLLGGLIYFSAASNG